MEAISVWTGNLYLNINGYLIEDNVNAAYGVRPVINLKADTKFQGSGTTLDPYTVVS